MGDFIINNTSWDKNYNYSNVNFSYHNDTSSPNGVSFIYVVHWIIICIELPFTLVAIFAVLSLVKNDHVTPVYVINLLISDLVQLGSRIALMTKEHDFISFYAQLFGVLASVGFMVCISLERYLLIAKPLWYRFRRNVKITLVVPTRA
ncbi:G-protein coupled receptor 4-like isoform X2 [Girardinichthys multiradiatus]|uniref:G-protein coupled receptor 4-like isoform X2 n=1 Tax=Girardinichthys multiradiatus TaxID=208333 RepID=UPI001FACB779|nr:G-protein coupled receptor 4-like isoform X2 [Girardinichthys multiradiatus]